MQTLGGITMSALSRITCALVALQIITLPIARAADSDAAQLLRARERITELRLQAKRGQIDENQSLLYGWSGARTQAAAASLLAAADVALLASLGSLGIVPLGRALLGPSTVAASLTGLAAQGVGIGGLLGGFSGTLAITYLPERGVWEFTAQLPNGKEATSQLSSAQITAAFDHAESVLLDRIQSQLDTIQPSGFKGNGWSLGWRTVKWLKLQRAGFEAQAALYQLELEVLKQALAAAC